LAPRRRRPSPSTPDPGRPLLVGLTGGIASGKSTALEAFARQGCATLSSDAVVHDLLRRGPVRDAVVDLLGETVLDQEGTVDRGRVAARVFGDPEALRALERLLHPLVGEEVERWRANAEADGIGVCVQEVPLLFESALEDRYDRIVLVTASDEVRRARDPARFDGRRAHQLDEDAKRAGADDVYVNDGTPAELEAWVAQLVDRLRDGR
jgi:dephospho-CoA kinase